MIQMYVPPVFVGHGMVLIIFHSRPGILYGRMKHCGQRSYKMCNVSQMSHSTMSRVLRRSSSMSCSYTANSIQMLAATGKECMSYWHQSYTS